jgi:hypothetical protein
MASSSVLNLMAAERLLSHHREIVYRAIITHICKTGDVKEVNEKVSKYTYTFGMLPKRCLPLLEYKVRGLTYEPNRDVGKDPEDDECCTVHYKLPPKCQGSALYLSALSNDALISIYCAMNIPS